MKRKMKAVAALSLAAVMLLAGCGSSKGTQDGGSAAAAGRYRHSSRHS